jgi:hypothetical protein
VAIRLGLLGTQTLAIAAAALGAGGGAGDFHVMYYDTKLFDVN